MSAAARHPHVPSPCCPVCGGALPEVPLAALRAACTPAQARILDLLARRPGLTKAAIAGELGLSGVSTQLARMRAAFAPLGWRIEARTGGRRGFRLAAAPFPALPTHTPAPEAHP